MKINTLAVPVPVPPSDTEVDAWLAVLTAARAADLPGLPAPSRVEVAGRLQVAPARGRAALWAVREGAGVAADAGVAGLLLHADGTNDHTAFLDVLTVRPDARRRGVGKALWARVREELLAQGRSSVSAVVDLGGPGQAFAESLGFENVLPMAWYAQELPQSPGEPPATPGYALLCWPGLTPDEWAGALAEAHGSMEDAPSGDTDERVQEWTAERLHAAQKLILDRGGRFLTVAAVTPAGEVAAYTELVLPDPSGTRALQYDTVVVPAHRRRGLGPAVKLRMMAEARRRHPALRYVDTTVADENAPMRAVNEALGYRRERDAAVFQLKL
ncbi:GNAT family N-acetyltransferase [Streptomyces sp. APSN-46.1]|uniref:GNAT family N-acetyltransferase n=1 Tax=Streptomyces sp. APSN-46.1 TaxID=2929049 RepID=UPI001FB531EA|nr:GNAT family N-acetyltransferase [Streptomyces sp. APSN-46.1]MCJ1677783.1 GNAT family N-acetyltransferase [Streptomyces sp. APSN-46.1]